MAGTIFIRGVSHVAPQAVSMESGLDGRNNRKHQYVQLGKGKWSQWSPA